MDRREQSNVGENPAVSPSVCISAAHPPFLLNGGYPIANQYYSPILPSAPLTGSLSTPNHALSLATMPTPGGVTACCYPRIAAFGYSSVSLTKEEIERKEAARLRKNERAREGYKKSSEVRDKKKVYYQMNGHKRMRRSDMPEGPEKDRIRELARVSAQKAKQRRLKAKICMPETTTEEEKNLATLSGLPSDFMMTTLPTYLDLARELEGRSRLSPECVGDDSGNLFPAMNISDDERKGGEEFARERISAPPHDRRSEKDVESFVSAGSQGKEKVHKKHASGIFKVSKRIDSGAEADVLPSIVTVEKEGKPGHYLDGSNCCPIDLTSDSDSDEPNDAEENACCNAKVTAIIDLCDGDGTGGAGCKIIGDNRDRQAHDRAAALLRELTPEELGRLDEAWREGQGHEEDIIARTGQDVCIRKSLRTLLPGTWLNDEVIHYYLSVVLAANDAELCRCDPSRRRSHFFKSFFMTKLRNHYDEANPGVYSYKNVKRWSRKVPGEDVFALDKIFFPINQGNMHWVCAVAYMQAKRIQFYDSFGGPGMYYLQDILHYLMDEHMDKKRSPMPDADEWELVDCAPDTPRQLNGFDCGVFTCMFCDFLSRDIPLVFSQEHMTRCRQRIALSILNNSQDV